MRDMQWMREWICNRMQNIHIALVITLTSIGISACSSGVGTGYGDNAYVAPTASPVTSDRGQTLTVMNFLNWCSVEINGGTASTSGAVTASVLPGSVATIVAIPASSSFEIGTDPWFGVDENDGGAANGTDVGSGTSESSTAVVTISATGTPACVSVCCEEPGNSPIPCPTTNPCL
jgi:hypothetical protein